MPIREIITCLLIILATVIIPLSGAYADSTMEIRPKRGLFLIENFQQWVTLTFQYSGHDANNANNSNANYTTTKAEGIYNILTSGAIMDKHLLNYSLTGAAWLQEIQSSSDANGSSSSSGTKYQYNLAISAFDRSWHPVNINSSRELSTVVNPFTPAYNSVTSNNSIEVYLQKGPVPARIRYERNTFDLSGGGFDSSVTSNAVNMSGTHNYRDFSSSALSGAWSRSNSQSQGRDQVSGNSSVGFGNSLRWGLEKKYSLTTQLEWTDTDSGGQQQQNVSVNESLLGHLGKALDADLNYRYLNNKTTTLAGQDQDYSSNSLSASLSHHLYRSLDTRLQAKLAHSTLPSGTEDSYSGSGSLTYKKKLPSYGLLTVTLFGEHGVTDRRSTSSEFTVRDEPHRVTLPGEIIPLVRQGPLKAGSVTVKGFLVPPPNPQFPPDRTFTEGIDYTVDYHLGQIIWGVVVPTVPDILVTYAAIIDPSVKYASDTVNVAGSLALLGGKFSLNGSVFNQTQYLISGQQQNSLHDTTIIRLRLQGNATGTVYGVEYQDYSSGPTQYQYVEGWWLYTRTTAKWALTLQARDRYTNYDSNGPTGGYGQNTLSASVDYKRGITSWSDMGLSANVIDTRRENRDANDALFLKANVRAQFNKLTVNLLGQSSWRLFGKATTRDDYVRITVTRYF